MALTESDVSIWLFPADDLRAAYASAVVSDKGSYSFSNLPAGSYDVFTAFQGAGTPIFFRPFSHPVAVIGNEVVLAEQISLPGGYSSIQN